MKTSLFSALLCLGITLAAAPSPEKVAEVKAGKITEACASWWGFSEEDSTEFLQAALNSGVRKLTVDYTGKDWIAGKTLTLPSNLELVIADKVVIKAKRGAFKGLGDALFRAPGSRNLTIRGEGSATLMMYPGIMPTARNTGSANGDTFSICLVLQMLWFAISG